VKQKPSLFRRTALTLAAGLLIFQLASGLAIFLNLVMPLGQRSADDLAALLVLSARIWVELPPDQRAAFEAELREIQGLTVWEPDAPLADKIGPYPYIIFLRSALASRLASSQPPRLSEEAHERFEVEFTQGGRLLRFEFSKSRVTPRPSRALLWTAVSGCPGDLGFSLVTGQKGFRPRCSIGRGGATDRQREQPPQLPESGEAELADLARVFNETSRQLLAKRENQTTLLAGVSTRPSQPPGAPENGGRTTRRGIAFALAEPDGA